MITCGDRPLSSVSLSLLGIRRSEPQLTSVCVLLGGSRAVGGRHKTLSGLSAAEKRLQTLQFIQKLADSTKNLEGEVLIQELLEATAEKLTAAAMERSEGSERGDS